MWRGSSTQTSKPRSASSCAAVSPATPPPRMATRVMGRRYTFAAVAVRRDQLVVGAAAAAGLVAIVVLGAPRGVQQGPEPVPTPAGRPLFGGSLEAGVR